MDNPLLVARRRVAVQHSRTPMPARRVLARGSILAYDGVALHWRHATRRRVDSDAASRSYGDRWVLLPRLPAPGLSGLPTRRLQPAASAGPPNPLAAFQIGRWLETA